MQPFTWQAGLGQVIAGWDQGVLGMSLGETRMIHIPAKSKLYLDAVIWPAQVQGINLIQFKRLLLD